MKYIYLASPYIHKSQAITNRRVELVSRYIAGILQASGGRVVVFSPVIHGHQISKTLKSLPTNFSFWRNQCLSLLEKADIIEILMLDGWDESSGILEEMNFAKENNIPIIKTIPPHNIYVNKIWNK